MAIILTFFFLICGGGLAQMKSCKKTSAMRPKGQQLRVERGHHNSREA